ncbi:putative component of NuA3 histone acetyltransferase complex [Coemansia erecta]|nr:putative component of NuA3 histone acetyltransferase complex [Coemansia sp. RSA 2618]KAJ2828871.1 putative component of NuA3 histone acetyltransferase complex [Coemansia erecta]
MPETSAKRSASPTTLKEAPDATIAQTADTDSKRARTHAPIASSFDPSLFANEGSLTTEFAQATPFAHTCIAPFCSEALLRGVRDEMLTKLHYTQKETDIFKYHQSGDLANLDGLPQRERDQLPCLQQLRDALYSQEFRDFVSRVTGCGPLSGTRTDMSTNRYKSGDHLLLHDDVIGDRRVSYIIYLPDPDTDSGRDGWPAEAGGGLELYARQAPESWAPAIQPAKILAPRWNQLVMFTVLPGQSHHAVQEVCGKRERLSIQGWFHFPQPGEPGYHVDQMQQLWTKGAESTLSQIAAKRQRELGCPGAEFAEYEKAVSESLAQGDRDELLELLNPEYLSESVMRQIADRFADDSHIQLAQFLNTRAAAALQKLIADADCRDKVGNGRIAAHEVGGRGWVAEGPPVVRRFLRLQPTDDEPTDDEPTDDEPITDNKPITNDEPKTDEPLNAQLRALHGMFAGPAFARWLAAVSGLALRARRGMVRRFRAGLDYTLATPDNDADATTLDAVLCLAQHDAWTDGAVGGYHCYVDSGDGDASNDGSVYRASGDDDGILLTTPAAWNSLSLVMREPNVVRFVKYVSAAAPRSRWDASFEYTVNDEDE